MTFNVLLVIILVTVGVSLSAFNNKALMEKLMFIPYDVKHNRNHKRIFTHILVHADLAHLLFNMFSLYFLGKYLLMGLIAEYGQMQGQLHFLTLYILGALFATIVPYARNQDNMSYRSLGASGAVSAVIFAFIIWNPAAKLMLLFVPIPMPAWVFGGLYLLYEFYADRRGGTGIAHDAHIGGAVFGVIYVLIINIDKGRQFLDYIIGA